MSTYLDEYGAADARRERIFKRLLYVTLAVALLAGMLWYIFRDFREERRVRAFLESIEDGNYPAAYVMWGCSEEAPCPNYSFENFMGDWGPNVVGDARSLEITSKRSCSGGIIQTLQVAGQEVLLWVDRQDGELAFAPWPMCNPRLPPEALAAP